MIFSSLNSPPHYRIFMFDLFFFKKELQVKEINALKKKTVQFFDMKKKTAKKVEKKGQNTRFSLHITQSFS